MLKITPMKGAGKHYYSTLSERDDYYVTKGEEEPGVWLGQGSELLGLDGEVRGKEFRRVFDGYAPDGSKEKLVQSAGRKPDPVTGEGGHRAGWDFTFSAVKSFSLMHALSDDPALKADFRRAHDEAVRETLAEIERHTTTRVRQDGKVVKVPAQMVAASFFHEAARGQDGQIPDPNAHSHCTIFNVTARVVGSKPDGTPIVKTTALEPRNLYEMELRFGRMYRDKLEAKVQALGFETYKVEGKTAVQDTWEVSGVPKSLIRECSKRNETIRKEARDESAEERDRAALLTRDKKQPKVHTKEVCEAHWREVAERHGFSVKNVPRRKHENAAAPFEHASLPARERFVVKADLEGEKTRRDQPRREVALYPEAVVKPRVENQMGARPAGETHKVRGDDPRLHRESARQLRATRSEWEEKGYKVICCAWSAKRAKAIEADTSIRTQTIQKTVKELQGKSMTRREVYAEYKYSTWQWSEKTKKKYLGEYYKPTSEAKHAWWYATHRISKQQMEYLNTELRRREFEVTKKTVVLVDAKQSPVGSKLQTLVSEVEKRGGSVIYTQELYREQQRQRYSGEQRRVVVAPSPDKRQVQSQQ